MKKQAFTLIELLMVIAIIAIISTLAVNKVGGIREAAARKVSLANQVAVERAVGSFLTGGGRLNRLDALVSTQSGDTRNGWIHAGQESSGSGFDCTHTNWLATARELYRGPATDVTGISADAFRQEHNAGVTPGLAAVLCPYQLTSAQVDALANRLGLRYVMLHNEYPCEASSSSAYSTRLCGDGSYVESRGDAGRDPNGSGCVAVAVTNTMALLAVNPMTETGRAIYRACGQELMPTAEPGTPYVESTAVAEAYATGGPLLAFGLGERASVVGPANAGLESAPYATYPAKQYYARYILLIRLRPAGSVILPEFAGVLDPCGHTIRAAREIIRNL